jgi:hypothetical protein
VRFLACLDGEFAGGVVRAAFNDGVTSGGEPLHFVAAVALSHDSDHRAAVDATYNDLRAGIGAAGDRAFCSLLGVQQNRGHADNGSEDEPGNLGHTFLSEGEAIVPGRRRREWSLLQHNRRRGWGFLASRQTSVSGDYESPYALNCRSVPHILLRKNRHGRSRQLTSPGTFNRHNIQQNGDTRHQPIRPRNFMKDFHDAMLLRMRSELYRPQATTIAGYSQSKRTKAVDRNGGIVKAVVDGSRILYAKWSTIPS